MCGGERGDHALHAASTEAARARQRARALDVFIYLWRLDGAVVLLLFKCFILSSFSSL